MYDLKICFNLLPALFSACNPRLALSPNMLVLSLHKELCWSTKVFMMDKFFFLDCLAGKVQGTTYYYKASLCIWQLWAKGVWVSFLWAKCLQTPSQREDSWSIAGRNQTQATPSLFVFDTSAWILYLVMQVSASVHKFSHYLWKMFFGWCNHAVQWLVCLTLVHSWMHQCRN